MKKIISLLTAFALTCTLSLGALPVSAEQTKSANQPAMENNMTVKGADSFGNMLSDEFTAKMAEQLENNGCNIFSAEVTDQDVSISFETTKDCTLVAAVYDEAGVQMLASGSTEVTAGETEKTVIIETENMPEYFYLKAYLVDTYTLNPVSTVYECPNYTKEMQEFFAKTVDDFDSEKVLNLDDDKTNNFAVFNDNTILIVSDGNSNKVTTADEENSKYVIENADSSVTDLKAGDVFAYRYDNGEVLIVKISDIKINGTTAEITGSQSVMEEVFEYVKIDASCGTEDITVDESSLEEGITLNNGKNENADISQQVINNLYTLSSGFSIYETEGEGKIETTLSYNIVEKYLLGDDDDLNVKISGDFELGLDVSAKYYVTFNYRYQELKLDYSMMYSFSISGTANGKLPLGYLFIPVVPGVLFVDLESALVVEVSAKIEVSSGASGTAGFSYDSNLGIRSLCSGSKGETEFNVEGTVFFGLFFKPAIVIFNKHIAEAALEIRAGAEIKAKLTGGEQDHACKKCIAGETAFKIKFTGTLKFLDMDKFKYEIDFGEIVEKLGDFYYSFDYNDFAFTTCPYHKHLVTINVKDFDLKPVKNIDILKTDVLGVYGTTDDDGKAEIYLPKGTYTFKATKNDVSGTTTVTVGNYDTSGTIILDLHGEYKMDPVNVNVSVFDNEGNPMECAEISSVHFKETYETDSDGNAVISLLPGSYIRISASAEGYLSNYRYVKVGNEDMNVKITLNKGNSSSPNNSSNGDSQVAVGSKGIVGKVKEVSLASERSGAITENGSLYMWGQNTDGELGNGTLERSSTPIKIMNNVKSVSLGRHHSAAITEDGSLYMWGDTWYGQLGNGDIMYDIITPMKIMNNVASVSLGNYYSAAITKDGSLYTWGMFKGDMEFYKDSDYGQLGQGEIDDGCLTPVKIMDNVASVSLGHYHSAAITKDGSLYMWGNNCYGQLGNGTTENSSVPIKIMDNVASVSIGEYYSAAITKDGSLYMWGDNCAGQIGNGTTLYYDENGEYINLTPIKIMDNVTSVSLGYSHSGAITEDGSLYMWGGNGYGQLGNGTTENSLIPIKIMDNVKYIDLGYDHSAAITEDGNLYTWGTNLNGQLGNGESSSYDEDGKWHNFNSSTPIKINNTSSRTASLSSNLLGSMSILANEPEQEIAKTESFTGLTPNSVYNFYVMKSSKVLNSLSADNLLYISQGISDENGNLSVSYLPEEEYENAEIFVKEMTDNSEEQFAKGDANEDGKINIVDAAFIAKRVAQRRTDLLPEYADYNEDGNRDIRDAAAIAKDVAARKI